MPVQFDVVWSTCYSRCILPCPVMSCLDVLIKYYHLSVYPRPRVPVPPSCVHRDSLRQDTMREFFLQQLKVLRESVVSSQTKMQEHLKASMEATDTNLKEELNHYLERLQAQLKTALQMLEEHFKMAGCRVEEMVKAMGESVTKRMNDMDKKLEELTSRITAMEVGVCSMLSST